MFADNPSLLTQSRHTLQEITTNLDLEAVKVDLKISAEVK